MRYDDQVFEQASQSLALFGWSLYEPSKAPSLEYLKKRSSSLYSLEENQTISECEGAWNALLDAYQFTDMDELDLVLLEGIRNGYFDAEALHKHAEVLDTQIKTAKLDESFREAWGLFHGSFDDNEPDVVRAILEAFEGNLDNISPIDLSGTVTFLKKLGKLELAREIIRRFIQHHSGEPKKFDLESFPFREHVTDPDVVSALNEKFASFKDDRDPRVTLLGVSNGWSNEDLAFLASVPVDEYYKVLKESDSMSLPKLINSGLQFDRIANASAQMKEISRRMKEALQLIGSESTINALRVRKYGVAPEEPPTLESAENT